MAKIADYPSASGLVATAKLPLYDPTDSGNPDKNITEDKLLGREATDATVTVGSESADVRQIAVQLKDRFGAALTHAAVVHLVVFASAAAAALSSGGSTGLAIGANGLILSTMVAKKLFLVKSDAAGLITLTWTDSGTDAAFLGVVLPDGHLVIGGAMTNT